MSKRTLTVLVVTILTLTACEPGRVYQGSFYNPSVISADEISSSRSESALALIKRTRPNFLTSRGIVTMIGNSSAYPTIYVDGMRYGSIATLGDIPANSIAEIRRYSAGQSAQFGPGNMGGVLAIRTRHGTER